MQHRELPDHLIFLTLHGSHAYGTSTPTSDWDVRGVAIAPLSTYFGTRNWEQLHGSSPLLEELLRQHRPEAHGELDSEIVNLTKFVRLAADANPNILDILFAHPDDWLTTTPVWETLYENRHHFLSMRVRHTYTGYAMSQLKRIKTHRQWLLHPPEKTPTRRDFGLPEERSLVPKDIQALARSMIAKKQQEWALDAWMEHLPDELGDDMRDALQQYFEMVHGRSYQPHEPHEQEQAAVQLGMSADLHRRLEAERRYKQARNHWKQYQTWLSQRNAERAALEQQFGYDCKHAMHLVRLLLSVEEILRTGDLSVRHPHAPLLLEVRQGAWTYEQLMEWAEQQEATIHKLAGSNPLPRAPDRDKIDDLVTDLILRFHQNTPSLPPHQVLAAKNKWPLVGERQPRQDDRPWSLTVQGLVNQERTWSLDELRAQFPWTVRAVDVHCVTRWSKPRMHFGGIRLLDLLDACALSPAARYLSFVARSERDHSTSLSLDDVRALDPLLAFTHNGEPLSTSHGGPLRTVVPGRYFYKSLKWLERIDVLEHDHLGYWEAEAGYHNHADPWAEERYIVSGLKRQEVQRLLDTRDLSNRDLLSLAAAGLSLPHLNATRALLRNADFRRADLAHADFSHANLSNAHLQGANLQGASFTNADVEGANFCGADLRGATFAGASLFGATFCPEPHESQLEGAAQIDASTHIDPSALDALSDTQQDFLRQALRQPPSAKDRPARDT